MTSAIQRRRVLPVLFFGVLMAALDIAIVAPALPAIQEHFLIDERGASWVINAFVVFNLIGLSLMTRLADVFGRKATYIADVLLFAVGSGIVALAPSFQILIVGRCIQGLAASGIFPVASAVVGDVYPYEKRGRVLGILGAVFGLAFLIGPIIGGVLLRYGWPLLFLINIPFAILIALVALRMLPHGATGRRQPVDVWGMVLLGLALASLAFGLNRIETDAFAASIISTRVWPFLVVSAILTFLFVRVEKTTPVPLIRLALLKNSQVRLAAVFAMGAGLTEAAFLFLSGFAIVGLGVEKTQASFMLVPLVLGVMIGSPLAGRLLDSVGSRAIIISGSLLVSVGMAILGFMEPASVSYYSGSVLVGIGLSGLLGSSISYILLNEAKVQERTVAQGISTLFISLGQLVGSALIGSTIASYTSAVHGYQRSFILLTVVGIVLAFAALGLRGKNEEVGSGADSPA
ncbi:MAG: MFS transporter [Rhodothermales bacterium]|nr:MFS transporter [Rhodothermales bacterium]